MPPPCWRNCLVSTFTSLVLVKSFSCAYSVAVLIDIEHGTQCRNKLDGRIRPRLDDGTSNELPERTVLGMPEKPAAGLQLQLHVQVQLHF